MFKPKRIKSPVCEDKRCIATASQYENENRRLKKLVSKWKHDTRLLVEQHEHEIELLNRSIDILKKTGDEDHELMIAYKGKLKELYKDKYNLQHHISVQLRKLKDYINMWIKFIKGD